VIAMAYGPMTLAVLAAHLRDQDAATRRRLVAEFLEEHRWEPAGERIRCIRLRRRSDGTGR